MANTTGEFPVRSGDCTRILPILLLLSLLLISHKVYNKVLSLHTGHAHISQSFSLVKHHANDEERVYFSYGSDGLLPRQHQDLAPRAERWEEI